MEKLEKQKLAGDEKKTQTQKDDETKGKTEKIAKQKQFIPGHIEKQESLDQAKTVARRI